MYQDGLGVERDTNEFIHHLEQAAIGGHPDARHNLGCYEARNGRIKRAVKHFIIAASSGNVHSMVTLRREYTYGNISKEDFAATLRAHQAAMDATKSPQREAGEAAL